MSFEKDLQEKLGEHKPQDIQELILDTVFKFQEFTEDQKNALEKYTGLIHLSMNGVGLTSLKNFPLLKELQILQLNKNKLKGDDLAILSTQCPNLYKLKIEENEIDSLDKFQCLINLKIRKLNLLGNPFIEKNQNYKNNLFEMFKSLESVDDKDKEGKEVESTVYGEEEDGDEEFDEADDVGDDDDGEDEGDDAEGDEGEDDEEEEKEGDGNTQNKTADTNKGNNKKKKN